MAAYFDPYAKHKITEANINYYRVPFVHPARKMGDHDFIYMLDGEWKIGQNDEIYSLKKDTLLILSANCEHYGASACQADTKTMYFHVAAEPGDAFAEGTGKSGEMLDSCMDVTGKRRVKKIFHEIVMAKLSGSERKAGILFDLLICELQDFKRQIPETAVAEKIKAIIHQNPEHFYSNAELARLAGVSLKNAEVKFRTLFGVTIHQYMLQFKMEQAILYWKDFPEMSVKEVAYNLGFYDEYHFSRQFKSRMGVSPQQYKSGEHA